MAMILIPETADGEELSVFLSWIRAYYENTGHPDASGEITYTWELYGKGNPKRDFKVPRFNERGNFDGEVEGAQIFAEVKTYNRAMRRFEMTEYLYFRPAELTETLWELIECCEYRVEDLV